MPFIAGTRPEVAALSPDGSRLLFQWDSSARDDPRLWLINTDGGPARQVSDSAVASCAWSPDGEKVAFIQKNEVFLTDRQFKKITRLTRSQHNKAQLTWSEDNALLAFISNKNIVVLPTRTSGYYQITNNTSDDISYWIVQFSPDSKKLLFVEFNNEGLTELMIPDYLEKEIKARKFKRGFPKVRIGIAPIDTGVTVWFKTNPDRILLGDIRFFPDGRWVLYEQFSTSRKHREIRMYDLVNDTTRLLYSETDEKWIEESILQSRLAQDGRSVFFTSERDGWNHLYTFTRDSSDVRQLTRGPWEVKWFGLNASRPTLFFAANMGDHAQTHLFELDVKTEGIAKLTSKIGTYESPVVSRNGRAVISSYSYFDKPAELYSLRNGKETRLTYSVPTEFESTSWVIPQIVYFNASDGVTIPAMLYAPTDLDTTRKYPCVVFVHGAGYLQNVFRGWSYYYREYMFNTYLVNKGYVVFEVDYRGSAGYGRNYRTDVYMHLGGRDLEDELDGVEYLKRLGYIDSTRIGMYGGSYGGFLPLMALFKSPETYACAAVLRAVTDWGNYYRANPWYTVARLGTPEENPEAYARSSPITFSDSLRKPLLVLHGVLDDNVFVQDAVQLVHKLQQAKKDFELMLYPKEPHGFKSPASWYDEYKRIAEFFDRHLQPNRE